jgi:SPOR domain
MPNGQNQAGGTAADAFLRPESMVTPGALGALAMVITNALANNFSFVSHAYLGIFLSFVFGLTAIINSNSVVQKLIYYVINSLIIFSVATGSNTIGTQTQGVSVLPPAHAFTPATMPTMGLGADALRVQFFRPWFGSGSEGAPTTISPEEAANGWSVIVASDKNLSEAKKLKDELNKQFLGKYSAIVSQNPSSGIYAVTVGGNNLSLSAAAAIQKQAVADGLAKDAYLKRSDLLQPVQ